MPAQGVPPGLDAGLAQAATRYGVPEPDGFPDATAASDVPQDVAEVSAQDAIAASVPVATQDELAALEPGAIAASAPAATPGEPAALPDEPPACWDDSAAPPH